MTRPGFAARRGLLALLAAAATAPGCVSLGGNAPAFAFYALEDLNEQAPRNPPQDPKIDRVLLVSGPPSSPFYDTTSLAYSRGEGARAYYQFSGWTERPARRIAQLAERRLATRGSFENVASATAAVRGDLLLNLNLEHLYHDAVDQLARVEIVAELVDWRTRALLARQRFAQAVPVPEPAAAAAVASISRATTELLDAIVPWVEQAARESLRNGESPRNRR